MASGRQEEDLGADFLGTKLAAFYFGRVIPEGCGLQFNQVSHDEPFQFRERLALEPGMWTGGGRILSHDKQTFDLTVHHVEKVALMRVIAGCPWQPLKSRSEEHTSELQSRGHLVCRLL